MNRIGTGFRLMFHLPVMWLALAVVTLALVLNNGAQFANLVANALSSYPSQEVRKSPTTVEIPKYVKSLVKTDYIFYK